ncbi:hypothetical protein [Halobacillus hunanensis]|uniref:hypothetical protein n=1 Tax=Halobacillus hunanensis TaxID=578214 RepID=UPI0009A719E1|nr:hypothetical protein [Halobacillus hunanensis]
MNHNNNGNSQKAYWAKDIADLLDIKTSTLRRWSIELEKADYRFYRDEHYRRAYLEKDIMPLRKLKEFLVNKMSMKDATKAVASMFPTNDNGEITLPVHEEKEDELRLSKREFKEYIDQVANQAAQRAAEETAKAMQEKLKDEFEKRDRILTQQLNESIEQKQIAAATEEQNKSWWKKLFSK